MDTRLNTHQQFPAVAAMERVLPTGQWKWSFPSASSTHPHCEGGQTLGQADQRDWRVSIIVDIWNATEQGPQKPVFDDSASNMWGDPDFLQIWTFLWFCNGIHVFSQAHTPEEHL